MCAEEASGDIQQELLKYGIYDYLAIPSTDAAIKEILGKAQCLEER